MIHPNGPPPEPAFSLLGLTIVRKTDLLAATAFLLALITTVYQFWGYVRGDRLALYPPDRILVFFDKQANGRTIMRLAADVTLINDGQPGQDTVVRDIDVTLRLDGRIVSRQRWLSVPKIDRDGERLKVSPLEDAHPVQVPGGGAVSRTVSFAPMPEGCRGERPCANYFVDWNVFLDQLSGARQMTLEFEARRFGGEGLARAACGLAVSEGMILNLASNGWHRGACVVREGGR